MIVNATQVKDYFNDPENIHKLYVYELVNFNNNIESVISENTNNFLKLKFFKKCEGIFESATFSPQIKILSQEQQDIGLKINTDYVFITNENMNFLEKTKKTFLFTINKPFSNDEPVYFLGENSLKAINELNSDLDDIKLDDDNLINLFSISLQSISKMEIGKNSNINFMLIEDVPVMKKINSISYDIPLESIYQTIQVIGTIKNDLLGLEIKNEKLDLEIKNNVGIIPLFTKPRNLNKKMELNIYNFILDNQIPLFLIEDFIQNPDRDIESIFDYFIEKYKDDKKQVQVVKQIGILLKKIILISYVYNNNFDTFDKNKKEFVEYYNVTYSNKTALEYNTKLIFDFQTKNPSAIDRLEFKLFKAICLALSHYVATPYSYKDGLTNEHKDKLWYYFDIDLPENIVKSSFNNNGEISINETSKIKVIVASNFFNFINQNGNLIIKDDILNIDNVGLSEYFLENKINSIKDESVGYKTYLFLVNKQNCYDVMANFSIYPINKTYQKSYTLTSEQKYPTQAELKALLPTNAKNIKLIGELEYELTKNKRPLPCPNPIYVENYTGRWNLEKCDATHCYYSWSFKPSEKHWEWRKFEDYNIYRTTALFEYTIFEDVIYEKYNMSTAKIIQFILEKNNLKNMNKIELKLNDNMAKSGWYISEISEDYHYSFLNSANKMSINYINENDQEAFFEFDIKNSFQKIDNTNILTRNKY